MWLWLLKLGTGLVSLATAAFAWFQRRDDVRAGATQQAAADERATIAAQGRELQSSINSGGATDADTLQRFRDHSA